MGFFRKKEDNPTPYNSETLKRERELYSEVCEEVADFVGLPKDSLKDRNLKFYVSPGIWPKFKLGFYKDDNDQAALVKAMLCPVGTPFALTKKRLRKMYRKAAHFAIIDRVYDASPAKAHRVLAEEKDMLYKVYLRQGAIRRSTRICFHQALHLLQKRQRLVKKEEETKGLQRLIRRLLRRDTKIEVERYEGARSVPVGLDRDVEKYIHYRTIGLGLRKSFIDEDNFVRNAWASVGTFSLGLLILGIIAAEQHGGGGFLDPITGMPSEAMKADGRMMTGVLATFASMWGLPHLYYRNSRSLTPKNLSKVRRSLGRSFTPKERRYLLAFPSEYTPLEKRLETLRTKYKFSI